jgi:hypothetical protein
MIIVISVIVISRLSSRKGPKSCRKSTVQRYVVRFRVVVVAVQLRAGWLWDLTMHLGVIAVIVLAIFKGESTHPSSRRYSPG